MEKELLLKLSDDQKRIYELLLTPIVVHPDSEGIEEIDGCIYSGISYVCECGRKSNDEDMSDVAIGFYSAIYGKSILDERTGQLKDKAYAGDTMNSFRTVAKNVMRIRRSIDGYDKSLWEQDLVAYESRYHCLANFWLIPYSVGRDPKEIKVSKAKKVKDYMDRFLLIYKKSFQDTVNLSLKEFVEIHYLKGSYVSDGVIKMFSVPLPKERTDLLKSITSMMEKRAFYLAKYKEKELRTYFEEIGIWKKSENFE